ncbi:MAG: type III pantothenate kinase [Candidatus Omnitrophota bacterium]|nr:MAG: type III pantothenate kinase [Candidatus Omnitrophota bacterium]
MILVDIGNTNVHFAQGFDTKISKNKFTRTCEINKAKLKKILSSYRDDKVLACSVVPAITKLFKGLKKSSAKKIYIAGEDFKVPIKSFYDKSSIGMDRLVCAFAAKTIYPHTRLVIDFGTAVTFDFISRKGDYEGGFILPGVGSTLRVLSSCALLPKQDIFKKERKPVSKVKIPRNTPSSIKRGIEDGFSAMVNSLVAKYSRALGISAKETIVITGGDFSLIQPYLTFRYAFDPFLVIRGLLILGREYL